MKNLTTAIFGRLPGSALATHIQNRMFKGQAPDGTDYPYICFMVVTDGVSRTFTEDYQDVVVQFSLFSNTSGTTEIENMYTDLNTLYDDQEMTITGAELVWMRRIQGNFLVEDHTTPTGTQKVWAYHVDFTILTSRDTDYGIAPV